MRKLVLLAGAAAMAAAMPAIAQDKGKGKGRGGGHPAAEAHAPGGGNGAAKRAERAQKDQRGPVERAHKDQRKAAERAQKQEARAWERSARDQRKAVERHAKQQRKAVEQQAKAERRAWKEAERIQRDGRRGAERHSQALRGERLWTEERRWAGDRRTGDRSAFYREGGFRYVAAYRDGCPPGLAKKNQFCLPPGQLRRAHLLGQALPVAYRNHVVPERYRYRFTDGDGYYHRWDDAGYVYRVDQRTNIIQSVVPVLASGLLVGEPLPLGYDAYNVPLQYRDVWRDDDQWMYRYDDRAIYRVNPQTRLVEGIVQMLAGGLGLNVGQRLPAGYDVYNVPFDHRDSYYDSSEHLYRYADGHIYQVDPTTRIIQEVISLIA